MFFEKNYNYPTYREILENMVYKATPQTGYHGTPYTFDKFDDSKFGTGEGGSAHGKGHYSANDKNVALRYKKPSLVNAKEIRDKFDLPHLFPESDKATQDFMIRNKINQLKSFIQDSSYNTLFRDKWIDELKKLEDLYNNRVYTEGNLYRVDVPNKNQMLWEYYYMDEQPKYIQEKLKPYLKSKRLNDPGFFNKASFYDMNNKYLGPIGKDIYKDIGREGLQKLGIKGINSYGLTDGDINVTFAGDDIKMANTPWQRFKNRIPTRSLGQLFNKVFQNPLVKSAGELAVPIQLGVEFYPALDIMLEKDPVIKADKYNKYLDDNNIYWEPRLEVDNNKLRYQQMVY